MATPIQSLVEEFVNKLESLIRAQALAAAQAALGGALGAAKTSAAAAPKKAAKPAAKPAAKKPAAAAAAKPAAPKKPAAKKGARVRRSPAEIERDVAKLVAFVRANNGVTNEKARAALGLEKTTWSQTLKQAVAAKQLVTRGEKRNTTLHVGGAPAPAPKKS